MKLHTVYTFLFASIFLLSGCSENILTEPSTENIPLNFGETLESFPDSEIALNNEPEEYVFDECGTREKFVSYNWYNSLLENLSTVTLKKDYFEESITAIEEIDIAEICYSRSEETAIVIIHPPSDFPDKDRNKNWMVGKYNTRTNDVSFAKIGEDILGKGMDEVEFGKRNGSIIKIHAIDRMYDNTEKTEYDYNYIKNTIVRKITCNYSPLYPDERDCF